MTDRNVAETTNVVLLGLILCDLPFYYLKKERPPALMSIAPETRTLLYSDIKGIKRGFTKYAIKWNLFFFLLLYVAIFYFNRHIKTLGPMELSLVLVVSSLLAFKLRRIEGN